MAKDNYQLTIDKIFSSSVRNNPDQVISYQGKVSVSYAEFRNRVYGIARGLIKLGLKKGDRVAVLDWDSLSYLETYYAVPLAGGVLHTVNIRYPPELIFYTMQHADDKFVIIRDEFVPMIEKSIPLFDFVDKWIVSSDNVGSKIALKDAYSYNDLHKIGTDSKLPELNENDLATIFYTSGTTGMPKGVSFTHRQIILHTLASAASLGDEPINMKSTDVIMPLVPMFHVHSWGIPYTALLKGMKYVLPGRYDFNEIPKIMEKEHVNLSLMVPSILYLLMLSENRGILPKLHLRVTIGGGALSKGLAQKAHEIGIEVATGYGMSETAPILTLGTYNRKISEKSEDKKSEFRIKTGIPVAFVDLRVVDKSGKEVPWDSKSIGEIIVQAPWLTSEYVKDENNTKKLWIDNWMHTGDLAVVDEYGYLSIVDREKDAVKSGGEFIPTIILEDIISTFPGVNEVAVVGKQDSKWGERPVAFVSGLKVIDSKKMVDHLTNYVNSGRIAKFWIPDEFYPVEAFEKTSTGKIDKKVLRLKLGNL